MRERLNQMVRYNLKTKVEPLAADDTGGKMIHLVKMRKIIQIRNTMAMFQKHSYNIRRLCDPWDG